jgi:hypothetical protein
MESMITMGGYGLPSKTIREMIVGSVDVIIQAARLRDGSRRITHITEVVGLEGEVIVTQDLFVYEITGEDDNGNVSAATARPASPVPASGTAPAITGWSASWPKPSTRRSRSWPRRSSPSWPPCWASCLSRASALPCQARPAGRPVR